MTRPRTPLFGIVLALALALAGCKASSSAVGSSGTTMATTAPAQATVRVDADGWYYDVEGVTLYLDAYGELPSNYVTKKEARAAGLEGGTPSRVIEGAAIGGDVFGNREGLLPELGGGDSYRECDINTDGKTSRGAERLIYTDDGDSSNGCAPYYYTSDHYESFVEVEVRDGEVVYDE